MFKIEEINEIEEIIIKYKYNKVITITRKEILEWLNKNKDNYIYQIILNYFLNKE